MLQQAKSKKSFYNLSIRADPLLFALIGAALALSLTSLDLGDFGFFYYAGRAMSSGASPYSITGFFSPLHLLLYAAPLSTLPYALAYRLNAFISALTLLLIFYRLAHGRLSFLLLMCAAPWLIFVTWYGQVEWLVMLGLFVNPIAGVFLLMLKPQIGWLAALLLLARMPRRQAALCLAGLALIFSASFIAGMRWGYALNGGWNTAAFPLTAIIALPIVLYAIRYHRLDMALSVAPALAPYVGPQSWIVLIAWLSRYRWALIIFAVLSWALLFAWRWKIVT